jgi:hypothetical protein
MTFFRPIQWYHSHADPIWPDGTFKATCRMDWERDPGHSYVAPQYYGSANLLEWIRILGSCTEELNSVK